MENPTTVADADVVQYPKELEAYSGEEDATAFLVKWLCEAYELVNRKLVPSEGWESVALLRLDMASGYRSGSFRRKSTRTVSYGLNLDSAGCFPRGYAWHLVTS